MSGLFVSYAHVDLAPVLELVQALRAAGYQVFQDTDEDHGIPAGTQWADELYRSIERADIVVFLASQASLDSPWCHTELAVAVARRRHVVQVSLSKVDVHPVLAERQALPAARSVPELSRRLLADLHRAGFPPPHSGAWDLNRSPYPGLHRLTTEYAPVFFGRDKEIDDILNRLHAPEPAPTVVVGPSGSGKSSLLRAGVLARLVNRKGMIVLPPIEPGRSPLVRFAFALQAMDSKLDADRVSSEPRWIADAVDLLTVRGGRVIACIDQAEDLLTIADQQSTTDLMTQLRAADPDRLLLLVALRSASMDAWDRDPRFAELNTGHPVWVHPMSRPRLREVIVGPAREAGISFEPPELVESILDDTHDGEALPLLAALLEELTKGHSRTQPVRIDQDRYDTHGPVAAVIERRANAATAEVCSKFGMTEEQVIQTFLRLVELDDKRNAGTTELEFELLPPEQRGLFEVFEKNGLVIRDRRRTTSGVNESKPVEVVTAVHQIVFAAWPLVAEAVRVQGDDLEMRSQLRREAQLWIRGRRGVVSLTGGRLQRALEWRNHHPDDLSPEVREYLNTAASQRRRRRTLTVAAPILGAIAAIVTVFAVLLFRQVGISTEARRTTDALRLVGEAESAQSTRPDLSLLLALEAAARGGDPRAVDAPFVALTRGPGPRRYQHVPARVARAAFGADGGRAILTDTQGNTLDWDAVAGRETLSRNASAKATAMSADGSTVAVSDAGSVGVRPFGSDAWRCRISGGADLLRLTPTGEVLVAVAADRRRPTTTVRIGSMSSCAMTSRHIDGLVADAAVDPAGERLALLINGDGGPRVNVINLRTGQSVWTLVAADDVTSMASVALAQDEVATLDNQGILRVWRTVEDSAPWRMRALPVGVAGVALASLARPPQAETSSSSRWLAAGRDGGLAVLTTGDDAPAKELAGLPPLGDLTDPAPVALGAGNGTANIIDRTGRITTWSFDTATAFDSSVLASERIDHVKALSDGVLLVSGMRGAWIVNREDEVHKLPSAANGAILAARDRTWALASPSGAVLLGRDSEGAGLKLLGTVASEPVAIAFLDAADVVVVERDGRSTVFGKGEPRTLTTGGQLGSDVVAGTAGADRLYLALASGRLAVVDSAAADSTANGRADSPVVRTYPAHENGVAGAVAISPDGKLLATGGDDRRIVLWDLHDGFPRARPALIGHSEQIGALAFNSDGTELASSAEDSTVIRWSVRLGERIGQPVDLPSIPDIAYSTAGGNTLVVGSSGVSRWPLEPSRWLEVACRMLDGRTFSDVERRQILEPSAAMVRCPPR